MEGAIQLTLIFGANSAASALVSPSTAPLEEATSEWKLNPVCTATVENKTMDGLVAVFNFGKQACIILTAPTNCNWFIAQVQWT